MDRRERRFAAVVSVAHGLDHFSRRLLPPLIPLWAASFGFPLWKIGLIPAVQLLGNGIGQAPMGVLSDRYDRRLLLSSGVGVLGASYVVFAAAPFVGALEIELSVLGVPMDGQFLAMLAAMFVSGVGSSVLHPTGYPLITANVGAATKGRVLGLWGSAAKFGDGLAPAVVGVALVATGWNAILLAFGAAGICYAALLFIWLRPFETRPRLADDREGGGLNVWRADRRLYVYPMLVVFGFFAVRAVAADGVSTFIPAFVTDIYGYSVGALGVTLTPASTASLYYSALLIAAALTQLGAGALVDRYDPRTVLVGFLVASALPLFALGTLDLSPVALFAVLLVLGATMWGMAPARDALISRITPAEREGRTFGYLWTGALLIGAGSPVVVGYIGDVSGLRLAFLLLSVATVVSAVPIALLFSRRVYLPLAAVGETAE